MTEAPIIVVYCEGPATDPHERFIIAAYRRAHTTVTATAALWVPQRRGTRVDMNLDLGIPSERW